jgi:predicted DNA-binding transcriptional regulator YafY
VLETSARLLRLLSLLQARRHWSGSALAQRLEVTERTIRRDVSRLRGLGYPVSASAGVAGGYQLDAGAKLPPLLLDDEEALAVALGLRTAAVGAVAGIEEAALQALAKLEQVLPTRVRRRVKELHAAVVPLHMAAPRVSPDLLSSLASACRNNERVRFRYEDGSGRPSERHVEPHGLVHSGSRWYLVCWDVDREDWRTFRADRIRPKVRTEAGFVPRAVPGGDLAGYVSQSVGSSAYTYQARVLLHAPLQVVAERIHPLAGRLEAAGEQRCVLETGSHSLEVLGFHLALIGVEFEVQSPPELLEHLRTLAGRLTRAASQSPAS